MGGSDQWGNITAGIELIRKVRGKKAHGLVWPLVKTAAGHEVRQDRSGHGVARSGAHHRAFEFYQFWLNTDDRDVINYLKFFTWLDRADDRRAREDGDRGVRQRARRSARSRAR